MPIVHQMIFFFLGIDPQIPKDTDVHMHSFLKSNYCHHVYFQIIICTYPNYVVS